MINDKILTLRDILKFCARRTGRTTEILNFIKTLLSNDCTETDKHYVVVTCNNQMLQNYIKELKSTSLRSMGYDGNRIFINTTKNNRVTFIAGTDTFESFLVGTRIDDVIFDTPEYSVFNLETVDRKLLDLMSRLK